MSAKINNRYYIHTRRLDGGGGIVKIDNITMDYRSDSYGQPYAEFTNKREAERVCRKFNKLHPAADFIVSTISEAE